MRQITILLCVLFSACIPTLERSSLELLSLFRFVKPSSTLSVTYSGSPFTFTQNLPINSIVPTTTGVILSCSSSPTLPTGLSIDNASCTISGTPTTNQATTTYTITAASSSASTKTDISITINTAAPSNLVYAGSPFVLSQNILITVQTPSMSGTADSCNSSPALPTGLSLSSTCIISGTPTVLQAATLYTITATNAFGSTNTTISIKISLALVQFSFVTSSLSDTSGSLTLISTGAPTAVVGKDGDAAGGFYFNGASQYLSIVNPTGLPSNAEPRTLCVWANPSTLLAPAGYAILANYGSAFASSSFGLYQTNNAGTQQVAISGYGDDLVANFTLPVNTWSHLCGTYDGSTARLYVNGRLLASGSKLYTTGSNYLYIAVQSTLAQYFNGKIDDVRIYNSALSATQIREIALQVPTGLLARYDFNGNPADVSGNNHSLTSSGSPALTTDRFNVANSAYTFDGATKFLTSSPVTTSTGGTIVLSAWFRPTAFNAGLNYIVVNGTGSDGYGILIDGAAGNVLKGIVGGVTYVSSTVAPPLNVWSHITLRASGFNWDLILNGVTIASFAAAVPLTPTTGTFIGSDANTGYFTGDIDDVRIYSSALTPSEILALSGFHPMQVSSWNISPAVSSLKIHYQSNSQTTPGAITTWKDDSGNANDLSGGSNVSLITNGINTKPAVLLNSTASIMTNNAPSGVSNLPKFSFYSVINPVTLGGSYQGILYFGTGGCVPLKYIQIHLYGNAMGGGFCGAANSWTGTFVATGTSYIVGTVWNNINAAPTWREMHYYINGVDGGGPAADGFTTPVASTIQLGNGASSFNGYIGDVLFFSDSLFYNINTHYGAPFTDQRIVECYLSSKYNVPLSPGLICP